MNGDVLTEAASFASSDHARNLLVMSVLVALSIEAWKLLFPLRALFQWWILRRWFRNDRRAYHQLRLLITGRRGMFFILMQPPAKFMGLIQMAAATVLGDPRRGRRLVKFLTEGKRLPERTDDSVDLNAARERDAREREVEAKLDSLQLTLEFWWAQTNRWIALVVTYLVSVVWRSYSAGAVAPDHFLPTLALFGASFATVLLHELLRTYVTERTPTE